MEQKKILFPRKMIAPQTSLFANDKIRIFACALIQVKGSRRVEPDPFFSESNLAQLRERSKGSHNRAPPRAELIPRGHARSVPISAGTMKLATMPATAPPIVISSGMMKCSKSINVATTRSETKTQ